MKIEYVKIPNIKTFEVGFLGNQTKNTERIIIDTVKIEGESLPILSGVGDEMLQLAEESEKKLPLFA